MTVGVVACAGTTWCYRLSAAGNLVSVNEFGRPAIPYGTPLNADLAEAIERDVSRNKMKRESE